MKMISGIIVVLALTACSGMRTSGRSDMGTSGYSGTSDIRSNTFNPDNPYHGG